MRLQILTRDVVCAALFAAIVVLPAFGETTGKITEQRKHTDAQSDVVVTETHITLIKNVLNLRAEQQHHWAPVEAALRDLAQTQAGAVNGVPVMRASSRGDFNVMRRLKRIAALAGPLLKTLDDEQRRNLDTLARLAGLEQLLASR
jgi:hypothetical protein